MYISYIIQSVSLEDSTGKRWFKKKIKEEIKQLYAIIMCLRNDVVTEGAGNVSAELQTFLNMTFNVFECGCQNL